jgi:7-carboxy-7-deazaguanine synthase
MNKIKVSEKFISIQGEGLWTGIPSVFMRTFGCNFRCAGFGMPKGQHTNEPDQIAKNIDTLQYKTFEELPLAKTGCDSYPSWHPAFKQFSPLQTIDEIATELTAFLPNGKWTQPNGQDYHLIITGGEPLLGWQRSYVSLLEHELLKDLKNLTFETNATQSIHPSLAEYLATSKIHVTWSCSPKLSVSGEKWEDAIRPEIVNEYRNITVGGGSSLYLKFVIANQEDIKDVDQAVEQYRSAGVDCAVYLMPMGGTAETYALTKQDVAEIAMKAGYRYSPRLHIDLFGNGWGT